MNSALEIGIIAKISTAITWSLSRLFEAGKTLPTLENASID
jgi:hypothetical protein